MTNLKSVLRTASIAFGVAICVIAAAEAQVAKVTGMMTLTGACKKLTVGGKNRTADCKGTLLNTDYSSGRTGFYFITTDGIAVTFSTRGDKQVHPDADTAISPVDMVIVVGQGRSDKILATGTCKFTNPYQGPAPIECRAESASGLFEASFMSDGGKPDVKTF
jgi:hypothetical protein